MYFKTKWSRRAAAFLFLLVFASCLYLSIVSNSSQLIINLLAEKSFPFQLVLLEGIPGLSQPQRDYMDDNRKQIAGLGMYLLTGVNISDPRTYFLSYFAPPQEGLPWLGWAYHPNDPEMEGPILEPLDNPFEKVPAPVTNAKDVLVGVYHTHSGESYAGRGGKERAPAGQNGDIVEAGRLLVAALNRKGIPAVQAREVNDGIFIKAYDQSSKVAKKLLEKNPTIRILIDLHRDGLPPQVGKSTVKIGGKDTAQIMVVIGQKNPNWEKNKQLADALIRIAGKEYPGLFFSKITYASEARYNQYLSGGAILLEIGSQLNTPEEATAAVDPLAEVLKEYLKTAQEKPKK